MRDVFFLTADIKNAFNEGLRKGMEEARKDARRKSSGTKTAADRRRADFPFARRHGAPLWDASTINVGTGQFRAMWQTEPLVKNGGDISVRLVNNSPVADYLRLGTRRMFARPVAESVEKEAERLIERAIEAELEKIYNAQYS